MRCEYCGWDFAPGEYAVQVFLYWRSEHLGGEAYRDGVKPVGWAHPNCQA